MFSFLTNTSQQTPMRRRMTTTLPCVVLAVVPQAEAILLDPWGLQGAYSHFSETVMKLDLSNIKQDRCPTKRMLFVMLSNVLVMLKWSFQDI